MVFILSLCFFLRFRAVYQKWLRSIKHTKCQNGKMQNRTIIIDVSDGFSNSVHIVYGWIITLMACFLNN